MRYHNLRAKLLFLKKLHKITPLHRLWTRYKKTRSLTTNVIFRPRPRRAPRAL